MHNWYVIISNKCKELYEHLAPQGDIQLFWPLHKTRRKGAKSDTLRPLTTKYLFVRTSADNLKSILRQPAIAKLGFPMLQRNSSEYQVVPEDEMQSFIWFCENSTDDFVIMDKLFAELKDNIKVRVKDGVFKDMEGVLCKIQHQNRFTFRVGELAIYIDTLRKWNLEIIDDGAKAKAAYNLYEDIDSLIDHIQNIRPDGTSKPYLDNAAAMLTQVLLYHIHQEYTTAEKTETNINAIKSAMQWLTLPPETLLTAPLSEIKTLHAILKEKQQQKLSHIVTHLLTTHHQALATDTLPDLAAVIPLTPYRPFLTRSAKAHSGVREYTIIPHARYYELITRHTAESYAHIALFPSDSGIHAIANTTPLYNKVRNTPAESLQRFPQLHALLTGTHPTGIAIRTADTISGPSLHLPPGAIDLAAQRLTPEGKAKLRQLIDTTHTLCHEIWSSPNALALRRELQHICTPPIHTL